MGTMTNGNYKGDLPEIPADPDITTYIELTENNAPRKCKCGTSAAFFVVSVIDDEFVVCEGLCTAHFSEAPRVDPNGRQYDNAS